MLESTIVFSAHRLARAAQDRAPIPPLTREFPDMSADDAYAIQLANVARRVAEGERVSGKKIGLTSPGIQSQLGVSEPDYGHLFSNMECACDVPADALIQPKIEAEIAFVLRDDLKGGAVTPEDVRRATECVLCAFEIVDSRIADWQIRLPDTVADNASSARYVLGRERVPLEGLDLAGVSMKMYRGDAPVCEGTGAAVLGDPCRAVAWLANCLNRYGVPLKRGEIILSGAFAAAPAAQKGDLFRAEFTHLGAVEARFV